MDAIPWDNPIIISGLFSAMAIVISGFLVFLNGSMERRLKKVILQAEGRSQLTSAMGKLLGEFMNLEYGDREPRIEDVRELICLMLDASDMTPKERQRLINTMDNFIDRIKNFPKEKTNQQ